MEPRPTQTKNPDALQRVRIFIVYPENVSEYEAAATYNC